MTALNIDPANQRFRTLIGTGGIGSGRFFALNGNHTLGREESRSGRFLDRRDYCKLHIVTHYVQRLMGPAFTALPIGKIGDDEPGRTLVAEMGAAGLDLRFVETARGNPTLHCICFVYPDSTGGNLTVDDSACALVGPEEIGQAAADMAEAGPAGIALAMPEVPLPARAELLRLATEHRLFRVASFTSGEIAEARKSGVLAHVDLLALNRDEAAALVGSSAAVAPEGLTRQTVEALAADSAVHLVSITAGAEGSWVWADDAIHHAPAHPVEVHSTAGAGDAHLSGLLAGLAAGLTPAQAHELAALTAAMSVTSQHTIHPGLGRSSLAALAQAVHATLDPAVATLLAGRD